MNKSPAHTAMSPYVSVAEYLCVSGIFTPLKRDRIRLRLKSIFILTLKLK